MTNKEIITVYFIQYRITFTALFLFTLIIFNIYDEVNLHEYFTKNFEIIIIILFANFVDIILLTKYYYSILIEDEQILNNQNNNHQDYHGDNQDVKKIYDCFKKATKDFFTFKVIELN